MLWFVVHPAAADVVKPVLAEVSFFADNTLELSLQTSIEALMSGIGTQHQNTKNAPNAAEYDALRALPPKILKEKFHRFAPEFLSILHFTVNDRPVRLELKSLFVDIVGYQKRPRKSILIYRAKLDDTARNLSWQYPQIYGDNAFRYRFYEADIYNWSAWHWLTDGRALELRFDHEKPLSQGARFGQFVGIGLNHVIPLGLDHILFIVAMALSSLSLRRLLIFITGFTLAHTLTLGLGALDFFTIPARIVEPLIAFSIAYMALVNFLPATFRRKKLPLIVVFGLLHGLGFADMLNDFETSKHFFITLLGFNIGVEIAQILIVAVIIAIIFPLRKIGVDTWKFIARPGFFVIGMIGILWTVERIFV